MNAKPESCKSVNYSYPTSPNADRFNNGNECWTVSIETGEKPPVAVAGFKTRQEAIEHAATIALPWSCCFLHCNPEFANV